MTVAAPVHTTGTQLPNYTTVQTKNGVVTIPDGSTVATPEKAPAATSYTSYTPGGGVNTTTGGVTTPVTQPNQATSTPSGTTTASPAPYASYSPQTPLTEDSVYQKLLSQGQGVIDNIQQGYDQQIAATTNADQTVGGESMENQNASAAASGLLGSSAALGGASKVASDTQGKINNDVAPLIQQRQSAVATALQNIQANAQSLYPVEEAQQQQQLTNAQDAVKSMATAEVNWDAFKQTPAYGQLVQQLGGDPNYADALFTMNKPQGVVDPNLSKVIGNTYYQVTKDPITGQVSSSSFDLPFDVPKNWTFQKVGTNGAIIYDPNSYNPSDPSTYKNVYVDPFTGQVTDGSGSSTGGTDDTDPSSAAGTAARNVQQILGGANVDMSMSLSDAVQQFGVSNLASAMVQNEGGSPVGVQNNPGNVKFTGLPGQTDSGVKASDGGTFASYATPEEGQKQVENLITNAASGNSSSYGKAPTLAGFVGTYTNTGTTPNLPSGEYGLLSNVQGFNPSVPGVDQSALNYLKEYLTQGKTPTAASVGVSTRTGSGAMFNTIAQRADDVYYQATGQHLPDATILASNKKLISGNNSILNNLSLQEGTIGANADLLVNKVNAANLNQEAPTINKVIDATKNALGNTDTASLLAQSSTLKNELASFLALKNATGTTVHDKLESAGLIDSSYNSEQIAAVVNTLMQEAQNSHAAITTANGKLYSQIDPLQLDPQNPLTNPTSFASSVGINLDAIKKQNPELTDQQIIQSYLDSN